MRIRLLGLLSKKGKHSKERSKAAMRVKMLLGLFISTLMVTGMMADISYAGPEQGARCPSGYTSQFRNNRLYCFRTHTEFADAVCPPINAPLNVERVPQRGRDRCKIPLTPIPPNPNSLPSVGCFGLGSGWTLQTDVAGFNDRCRRSRRQYACPSCSPL